MDFFIEEMEIIGDIPGITPSYVMQPIENIAAASGSKIGRSPLGIQPNSGPILSKFAHSLFNSSSSYAMSI